MNIARPLLHVALTAMLFTALPATAAKAPAALPMEQVKLGDAIKDMQRAYTDGESIEIVWWLPKEYWRASFAQNKAVDEKQVKEFIELFSKYTVVAAVQGQTGPTGIDSYTSEADLWASLRIQDASGQTYEPIAADKIDRRLGTLFTILRPMLKQALGEVGDNMRIFVFPGAGKDKKRIADPLGNGQFAVTLGANEHRFRLPLGSFLVPRKDPATGETFPGNYYFSPYTGAALEPLTP